MAPIKSPQKSVSKPKAKAAKASGRTKARTSSLLKSLPESVEHIEIVQQVACVIEELQKRVLDVKAEASKELRKLLKLYENNYKGLEKKVHQVTSDAKKQAQMSMIQLLQKWHEHKEKLPTPVAKEIEKIVAQIGMKVVERRAKAPAKSPTTKPAAKPRAPRSSTRVASKKKSPSLKNTGKSATPQKRKIKASAAPKVVPMPPVDDKST